MIRAAREPWLANPLEIALRIQIRKCRQSDLLNLEWFGAYTAHRQIIQDAYDRQRAGEVLMLVADSSRYPVGQVWIDFERYANERIGLLWALRVIPWLEGYGLGSALCRVAEQALRDRGWTRAAAGVEIGSGNLPFYRRLGYRRAGRLRETFSYVTPDHRQRRATVDQWMLVKQLAPDGERSFPIPANWLPARH